MTQARHVYVSKEPDAKGLIHYDAVEHDTWARLYRRQVQHIQGRACAEYVEGLAALEFSQVEIPQHRDVSRKLSSFQGWSVQQVPALIPASEFFGLLSHKKFPAASFIRLPEEFDYIMEPDIFHEFFGHCPLLTNRAYAEFVHAFGKIALEAKPKDRVHLFRLFWFTIEFGLLQTTAGTRAYGGGILSSYGETSYALDSATPKRVPFDPVEALRTPYRIDIMQPLYYVIDSFDDLFGIIDQGLHRLLERARELGSHAPLFPPKD